MPHKQTEQTNKTNKVIRRHSPVFSLNKKNYTRIIKDMSGNTLFWKNNIFLSMDTIKVLESLDYSVFIFAKLRVSPVRSSVIYLAKRFNRYIYIICPVKKYGRAWFFDCSGICKHRLPGINVIHESPLIENFCFNKTHVHFRST